MFEGIRKLGYGDLFVYVFELWVFTIIIGMFAYIISSYFGVPGLLGVLLFFILYALYLRWLLKRVWGGEPAY